MWLWIYFIVTTTVTVWACRRYVLAERRAQEAVEVRRGVRSLRHRSPYERLGLGGAVPAVNHGEIDAMLKDLGMHEDDQVCGHTYRGGVDMEDQIFTCGLGRWAHDPYHGLDHEFIPVDVDRCPGHPDLPLGHDTD